MIIRRGDIFYADLSPVVGSEQSGIRPVIIIQNDIGNKYSPTVIGVPITSKQKNKMPTHIEIEGSKYGLEKNSVILAEQIRTIDKIRLKDKVGKLDKVTLDKVKHAIEISCGLRGKMTFNQYIKFLNSKIYYQKEKNTGGCNTYRNSS